MDHRRIPPKPTTPNLDLKLLASHISETAILLAEHVAKQITDGVSVEPVLAARAVDYMAAVEAYRKAMAP